jgi:hypothetical protein
MNYFLLPLVSTALFATNAMAVTNADDAAPKEVIPLAPRNTHLIDFKANSNESEGNAVAVFETNGEEGASRFRTLLILRKQNGQFKEVDRSDKIIACSTCGQFRDDPFKERDIVVKPNEIEIRHADAGERQSTAYFRLAFDPAARHWHVVAATRTDITLGRYDERTYSLPLPASGLVRDFDAGWTPRSYWTGVSIEAQSHKFHFESSAPSKESLDQALAGACRDKNDCRIIVSQQDGCVALAEDEDKAFFTSKLSLKRSTKQVTQEALADCIAKGAGTCKVIRAECSLGSQ